MKQVTATPAAGLALVFDLQLFGCVLFEQVQCDLTGSRQIFGRMALPGPGMILGKSDIEHPMQLVFDVPMACNTSSAAPGVRVVVA
ncbi:hypothetical protein A8C75_01275 [Marinobacterium aestuarii]|uniref:Uncharacterized protein n=1 Tax=Marinobacterium aestuarii TaxID=1821621 RepID=A0A1A9EUK7_9GAMM|nr:hypothetical protein A8C75_01275 [Marinobacterium aestuarii]